MTSKDEGGRMKDEFEGRRQKAEIQGEFRFYSSFILHPSSFS
jgi:hypothetical protein